ncbi:MAG: TIGR02147 family protein [Bdellovibrionales bacterium]|nr:TIGR02147 family protein [Bdellovibrionales bacterium]
MSTTETKTSSRLVSQLKKLNHKPVLGAYTDFRRYLFDFYSYKKIETADSIRPYSYAHFSAAADIKSPNYLKLIIEGQRNLSGQMIGKFSRALGLTKSETEEFGALVMYGQAKTPTERNQYLKVLSEIRVQNKIREGKIESEAFESVPSWVMWVLYAMAEQEGVNFDVDALKKVISHRASREEVQASLNNLLERGELVQSEDGKISKGRELMSGGQNVPVELVRKLQAELIYLGLESLFQDRPQDREFGALTLALTEKEFEELKFEVRQLRKRWFKDFSVKRKIEKGDRVFQINFQLFPITRSCK